MLKDLSTTIINSLPVFATIAIVIFLRKKKVFTKTTKDALKPIIFKLVLPFFVFNALYGMKITKEDLLIVGILILIAILLVVLFFIVYKINKWPESVGGALLICILGFQVGPFAYPFVQLNFDQSVFSKVVIMDITLFVVIMVIGPIIASILGSKEDRVDVKIIVKRILSDVVLQTVVLSALVNVLDINIPSEIMKIVEFIARPFTLLTLLLASLSLTFPSVSRLGQVLQTFLFRNIFLIIATFLIIQFITTDGDLEKALLLVLFTPFSAFALVYTDKYKIDEEIIVQLSVASLIIYLAIYPFVVTLAKSL